MKFKFRGGCEFFSHIFHRDFDRPRGEDMGGINHSKESRDTVRYM